MASRSAAKSRLARDFSPSMVDVATDQNYTYPRHGWPDGLAVEKWLPRLLKVSEPKEKRLK